MPKYLMLKHYRGAPTPTNDERLGEWTPEEWAVHIQFMQDFAERLQDSGEFVSADAVAPEGTWVRFDGEGKPPVTDGPFPETKDLIAGWMIIDVADHDRALELAAELSSAPAAGGRPLGEWLELRPVMSEPPTVTE